MDIFDEKISQLCKSIGEIGTKIEVLQNKDGLKKVEGLTSNGGISGGVYVLWEKVKNKKELKPIYVGLSKDVLGRIKNHSDANMNTSSFAFHLIREKVAEHAYKNNQGKSDEDNNNGANKYMISSFTPGKSDRTTKKEVNEYIENIKDEEFLDKIKNPVKKRIKAMYFTCVGEEDYLQQALIEIFCMKLFGTITTEKILEDNIDKKKFKYKKYNFSY